MQKTITVTYCDICREERETIVPHGLHKSDGRRLNLSIHDKLNNQMDLCEECLHQFLNEVTIYYYPHNGDVNVRTFSLQEEK